MKSDRKGASKHGRAGVIALGAATLLIVSYIISLALHGAAVRQIEAARKHIARDEWLAAIRCLDRAQWEDPFLIDSYLLRATAINGHVSASELTDRTYSRRDALVDIDWYLRFRPDSGEAHYERGVSLGLAKAEAARRSSPWRSRSSRIRPTRSSIGRPCRSTSMTTRLRSRRSQRRSNGARWCPSITTSA